MQADEEHLQEEAAPADPAGGRLPLAYDVNGNPLELPAGAVAWRVRRGGGKRGRPRNVFNAETGRQLEVPLGATIDDLIEAGCVPGRYLLYPVDATGQIIADIVAVTAVAESEEDEEARAGSNAAPDLTAQLLATVRAQSDTLCRALEAATSGYGPVRPATARPLIIEQPSNEDSGAGGAALATLMGVINKFLGAGALPTPAGAPGVNPAGGGP